MYVPGQTGLRRDGHAHAVDGRIKVAVIRLDLIQLIGAIKQNRCGRRIAIDGRAEIDGHLPALVLAGDLVNRIRPFCIIGLPGSGIVRSYSFPCS